LVFVDRLVATLIWLRHDMPHSVLGRLCNGDLLTATRTIGEIRVLIAERGRADPGDALASPLTHVRHHFDHLRTAVGPGPTSVASSMAQGLNERKHP
jgi:hypothetical protein